MAVDQGKLENFVGIGDELGQVEPGKFPILECGKEAFLRDLAVPILARRRRVGDE
jgi:hypothetical protein